jgi:hypothetical protein
MGCKPTTDDVRNAEDSGRPVANDQGNVHHLAVIRLGKAALVEALKTGAVLKHERKKRGDNFEAWVAKKLALSPDEINGYIRFHEECGFRPEQLAAGVDVKSPRVFELLGQLSVGEGVVSAKPNEAPKRKGRRRSKATVDTDNTPAQLSPKPKEAKSRPAEPSADARERDAKPAEQARNGRQSELTAEQRQFLIGRSPRLLVQVRMRALSPEAAICIAEDLPDRSSPQKNTAAATATNHEERFSKKQ